LSDFFKILTPRDLKTFIVISTSPLVKGLLIIEIPSARLAAINDL